LIAIALCGAGKLSPSHLSRLFKKEIGMYFLDYVFDQKLKHAQQHWLSA
jgi:methylphosphotriester-DNA--protein-cysteine methyltransferase